MLDVQQVTISRGNRPLIADLDLSVQAGEIWTVLGLNGSGKTTLLHTLAGLLPYSDGTVSINNKNLTSYSRRELAKQLGLVFQQQEDPFPVTVQEAAEQACFPHHALWSSPTRQQHAQLQNVLLQFELDTLRNRDLRTLSGGERQRLAIASLQIQNPKLWLLDEPTNHLDIPHQLSLLKQFKEIAETQRVGMLIALHDINQASQIASHCLLLLEDKSWVAGKVEDTLTADNLTKIYGCEFSSVKQNNVKYWIARN